MRVTIAKSGAKEMRYLLQRLQRDGHTVDMRKGHYLVKHKNGTGMVVMASTPSDHRALKNTMSDLRRNGFEVSR